MSCIEKIKKEVDLYIKENIDEDEDLAFLISALENTPSNGNEYLSEGSFSSELMEVKIILTYGADPNTKTKSGSFRLGEEARGGNLDIIKCLIEFNANVNETDRHGRTA